MTEQEENELICSKLLGWKRVGYMPDKSFSWLVAPELIQRDTPSFTIWAEAGLILDALTKVDPTNRIGWSLGNAEPAKGVRCFGMGINGYKYAATRDTGPQAIRDAALLYLRPAPQADAGES